MPKTVLLVEDYDDARSFMKLLLEKNGYRVIEAQDGYEAVEIVNRISPDIILMDLSLPNMDGIAATKIIRKIVDFSRTPIIAVTAHGDAYFEKAIAAGCNDLLNKPLDIRLMEIMLKHYLPN
jgi:CheY-like chemotaxis protein